jgi:hypothetical protein
VIQFPGLEIGDNKDENQELRNTQLQDLIAMISIPRNHAADKGTQSLSKENSGYPCYVPKDLVTSLVLSDLEPRFKAQGQSVVYVVDRVHYGMTNNRGNAARLCDKFLKQVLGQKNAKPIIDACLTHGILETDGKSIFRKSCRGFVLGGQFQEAEFEYRALTAPCLLGRLAQVKVQTEATRKKTWRPWHYRWEEWQKWLGIDKPLALELLHGTAAGKDNYSMQTRLINDIDEGRYRIKLDPQGRLYGNSTNVKTEVRKALLLGGKGIEGLDVRNSQPAFLGMLLVERGISGIANYVEMACTGVLYNHLARLMGILRDEAKGLLFRDVFGKKGEYPSEMENVFESEFPTVHKFIREFNQHNHGALLRELQRVEADLVIHRVAMSLPKDYPFFSIHDGVYCQTGNARFFREAFDQNLDGFPLELSPT